MEEQHPIAGLFDNAEDHPRFNGADYIPARDDVRLTAQIRRVFDYIQDRKWHTLNEIASATGDPEASVSAQLRHLRKKRFGRHVIERRHVGNGLYQYRYGGKQNDHDNPNQGEPTNGKDRNQEQEAQSERGLFAGNETPVDQSA